MPLLTDGKEYEIDKIGKIILFPISKISQALTDAGYPRDTQTIRKWEGAGILPKTPFRHGGKRLYSQEHVDIIVKAVVECNLTQGTAFHFTPFKETIAKYWVEVNRKLVRGK